MSENTKQYKPGDIADGHVLGDDGVWSPVPAQVGHATPAQPQYVYVETKKKGGFFKKFLIFVAVISALMIAGVAGCTALVGGAANEIDKEMKKEQALDKPFDVTEGETFSHDGYEVAAGWKVVPEELGMGATITGLKVTNVDHEQSVKGEDDTPMFTFTLWNGEENVTEIQASGRAIAQGQTTKMDAFSLDTDVKGVPAYDRITVKDAW
jgi:hypothetical protein